MILQNFGDGKFQELSREMDREGLKEKAPSYLSQSAFIPVNLNAEVSLLEAPNAIVCESYSPFIHWEKLCCFPFTGMLTLSHKTHWIKLVFVAVVCWMSVQCVVTPSSVSSTTNCSYQILWRPVWQLGGSFLQSNGILGHNISYFNFQFISNKFQCKRCICRPWLILMQIIFSVGFPWGYAYLESTSLNSWPYL